MVSRLGKQGLRVALVERELVGGECAYWPCIPTKTLLHPPEVRAGADRAAGVDRPDQRWAQVAAYRDYMIRNLDDREQVEGHRAKGIDVYKGEARNTGPDAVAVGDTSLFSELLVATGRQARVEEIGPETVGLEAGARGIEVDECCRPWRSRGWSSTPRSQRSG